jgi:hypothetical protein
MSIIGFPELEDVDNLPSRVLEMYNKICGHALGKVLKLSIARNTKIVNRCKILKTLGEWEALFERVMSSSFLKGRNDRNWKASFDWIIRNDDNPLKVLEGKYDDKVFANITRGTAKNTKVVID